MKKYATTLIIWASLLVNEAHTLFSDTVMVDFHGRQMAMSWLVWFVGNSVWGVMMAAAILLYQHNRVNKTTVMAYLLFCLSDTAFLFINYKQSGYEAIYTFLLIAWVLIYNYVGTNRHAIYTFLLIAWVLIYNYVGTNRQGITAAH